MVAPCLVVREALACAPTPCRTSIAAVEARVAEILRPDGALARLDELAVWLAGWQRSPAPDVARPAALIFAGDHGVAADGVSAYPSEVTAAMLEAFRQDRASISAMAEVAGAEVQAIDVGVGEPTGNIRIEPAMDDARFERCFEAGREAVRGLRADLLIVGEMGIGNTTAAAAVCCALTGRGAAEMVGTGTGVAADSLALKVVAVDEAVGRARAAGAGAAAGAVAAGAAGSPFEVLRELGGTELVAMAGAIFEARMHSIAVLLDGYVTSAAALVLWRFDQRLTEHVRAGHRSAEPGHRLVLEVLGLEPLITLDLRLGEGSGAMAAVPLAKMACRLVTEVPTFGEWFGPSASR